MDGLGDTNRIEMVIRLQLTKAGDTKNYGMGL